MTNTSQTYVYDQVEVRLTGRTAQKELKSTRRNPARQGSSIIQRKYDELVEIETANTEDIYWKKFVRMSDLYKIMEKE